MNTCAVQRVVLEGLQSGRPVIWVGAVSFEQRCLGSLQALASAGFSLSSVLVVDYSTAVSPKTTALQKRKGHWAEMRRLFERMGMPNQNWSSVKVHPYRLGAFRGEIQRLLATDVFRRNHLCIIDMTCLTKAHTLALASWVMAAGGNRPDVLVAYTRSEQYGTPARHRNLSGKWLDTVLAPLELNPQMFMEKADGIVLLGHEGARISMALTQSSPQRALVILTTTTGMEHLQTVTRTANARLLGEVERGERPGWSVQEVNVQDIGEVYNLAKAFVSRSVSDNRRVILYPFGPKPLVFATCLAALAVNPTAVWYCYPIPKSYDVDYTMGIGTTEWFSV